MSPSTLSRALAALSALSFAAQAQIATFQYPAGNYSVATNWSTGAIPQTNDLARIAITNIQSVTHTGGTFSAGALHLGTGLATGSLTVTAGTLTYGANSVIGSNGAVANLLLAGGSVVLTGAVDFGISTSADTAAAITNNAGTLTVDGELNVARQNGTGISRSTLTINGGTVAVSSNIVTANGNGETRINLNGGVLETRGVRHLGSAAAREIRFNGGTLRANTNNTAFLPVAANAVALSNLVMNGGAILDSQGFTITAANPFRAGPGSTGGLVKTGSGQLELTSSASYTGATRITAGTLRLSGAGSLYTTGAIPGSIEVEAGGTLLLARNDAFGTHGATPLLSITISTNGVVQNTNTFNSIRGLLLRGGELRALGGASTNFGAYQLKGTVTVVGATSSRIVSPSTITNLATIQVGNNNPGGQTVFDVADTADANDLSVEASLVDGRNTASTAFVPSGFIKTGAGVMRLESNNTMSGLASVNAGTLSLGPVAVLRASNIAVAAGAVLDVAESGTYALTNQVLGGSGTVRGSLLVGADGQFQPGGAGTPGTLTVTGQVDLASSACTNFFDLTNSVTVGSGINDLLQVGGSFGAGGSVIAVNPLAVPVSGPYRLINYGGTLSGSFDPVVRGNVFRQTWTLSTTNPGAVDLVVSDVTNVLLSWSGNASADWDTGSLNWTNLATGLDDKFYTGDSVLFDDTGLDTPVVNIATQVRPAAVTVDTTGGYSFIGANRISDPPGLSATLTKTGPGTLVVHNTNDYSGGTIVSGGVLQVGAGVNSGALGPGTIRVVSGGTLAFHRVDNPYVIAQALSGDGTLLFLGTGVSTQSAYGFTGVNTGFVGTMIVSNGARIALDNANDLGSSGAIQIKDGASLFQSAGTFGRPVEIAGIGWTETSGRLGALRVENATWAGPVTLTADARVGAYNNNGTISGTISGPYELEIWAGPTARSMTLSPTGQNAYAALRISSNAIAVAGTAGAFSSSPVIMNGGTQRLNGFSFAISNLSSTVNGGTIVNNHATAPATLTVGLDDSSTAYGGVFANGGAAALNVTKVGAGTLTLDGANVNSGVFTIQTGALALGAAGSIASSSSVTLAGGAFDTSAKGVYATAHPIRGSGALTGAQLFNAGASVNAGTAGTAGTIAIAGDVGMAAGFTNLFDLSTDPLAVGGGTNDLIAVTGNLEPSNSVIAVNSLVPLGLGSYTLFTYTGAMTSQFNTNVPGNTTRRNWTLVQTNAGVVTLDVSGGAPKSLKWLPAVSAEWDAGSTNWFDTLGAVSDRFFDGDAVVFDDDGLYSNVVTLTGALLPATVSITTTGDYTFAGSGRVQGPAVFIKSGAGVLTISNANDFTGAFFLSNGIVRAGSTNAFGSGLGPTYINGGALDLNGTVLSNQGERFVIQGTGFNGTGTIFNGGASYQDGIRNLALSGDAAIANWLPAGRWDLRGANNGLFAAEVDLAGYTLSKIGPGRVSLIDASITNAGSIRVEAGMLEMSRNRVAGPGGISLAAGSVFYIENFGAAGYVVKPLGADAATITNSGSTFVYGGPVTLTNNSTITLSAALYLTNAIGGPGGFTKQGNSYVILAASNTFAGPVTVNNSSTGALVLASATGNAMPSDLQLGHSNNVAGIAYLYTTNDNQFGPGVTVSFGGSPNDWSWMKLFGTRQSIARIVSDDNGGGVLDHVYQENGFNTDSTLILTGPGDSYWSGHYLRDNGGGTSLGKLRIVQAGPGTASLAGGRGSTLFSGGVVVSNGVLNLKSHYAAGRGTVTLAGGMLALDGSGLKEDIVGGAFNTTVSNSLISAVKLSPVRADTKADLGTNTMYIYTGYIVNTAAVPVTWTFAEQFDDNSYLKIDNTVVLNDTVWSNPTYGSIQLSPGLHSFDLRAHNGSSQGGPTTNGWWTNTTYAFGIDLQGRGTPNQDFFARMQDPGDGSFFLNDVQLTNPVVLAADATVRVSSAIGPTNAVNGPIVGPGSLTKTGGGALSLGGSNDYSGATTVAAGRLLVDGVLAQTPAVAVASNASLIGTGTVSVASVTVAGGGTIGRLLPGSIGALTVANLTLDPGANVSTILTGTNPSLRVTGAFVTSASNPLRVLAGVAPTVGTNVLIDYTGTIGGAGLAGLALLTLPSGAQGYLQDNPLNTTVELVITNAGAGVQWFGGVDSTWDVLGTANWKTRPGGVDTVFTPFDAVLFDDSAATAAVTLALAVTPASVTVSNTLLNYTLALNGIAGSGGLLKQGAGLLVITNVALDSTGTAVVAGGTLKLENMQRFGGSLFNQSTVELAAASGEWAIGTNRTVSGDGLFRKTGAGTVSLSNVIVAASNLIEVQQGTLRNAGNGSIWTANQADLNVASGAAFDLRGDPVRFDTLSGAGTITNSWGNTGIEALTFGANNGSDVFSGTIQDSGRLLAGQDNGTIGLLKIGAGTQALGTVSIAGGITLDGGALALTADSAARGLLFGPAGTSTNVGLLDLSAASLVVTGLTSQVSTSTPSIIFIGAGRTLTVNGTVTIGNNSGTNRFTSLNVSGAGSLLMTGPVYQVGAGTGAANFDTVTNDLSNLGTFVADLGIGGTFRVGNLSSASPGVSAVPTVLALASNSTIVANLVGLGDASGQGTLMGSLLLGAQSNTIYANTINIGLSGTQRSSGRMLFAGATGNLTVRGASGGSSRANVNVLNHTSGTGTFTTGLLDLTGHPSDLLIGTLVIDSRLATSTVGDTGAMHFNNGVLDVTTVIIGRRASTGATGTGSLNIGGGVVNIGTGGVALANSTTAGGTSIGQLNLTGGVVTVSGRIYRVGGLGTSVASLNLDGATLDLQGNTIGGPAATNAITNLVLASGTLANVAEINNGAPWAKTTTGTLVIAGSNAFSGAGYLSNGMLLVNGTLNGGGLTTLVGTTLGGTGLVGGTVQAAGNVAPGASAGLLSIGLDLILGGSATQIVELGGTTAGVTYDQLAVGNFASVGGASLEVRLINGHTPAAGNAYTVLVASTVSGPFALTSLPVLGGGLGWDVQYPAGAVVLAVTGGVPPATGYDLAATVITNGLSGYNDDADGDGYANLLEYVTGGSLTNPGTQAQMNAARTNGMLALKFSRDTAATDATIYVEGSFAAANGSVWTPVATNLGGTWGGATNVTESGPSPVSVTVQDTIAPATNRFLRLRVTRP